MATKKETVDYLLEQLRTLRGVVTRKMFGEYALYLDAKVVGLICDDQLFLKPTDAGKALIGEPELAPPYPGAKAYYLIPMDSWEDMDWFAALITQTASELPPPKPKKVRSKRKKPMGN